MIDKYRQFFGKFYSTFSTLLLRKELYLSELSRFVEEGKWEIIALTVLDKYFRASVIFGTSSGSFGRQRRDTDGWDCRRWAQIKTLPNPIRDGNCVRSSGQQIHRGGWLADYIAALAKGESEFTPGARAHLLVSTYLTQPFLWRQ